MMRSTTGLGNLRSALGLVSMKPSRVSAMMAHATSRTVTPLPEVAADEL